MSPATVVTFVPMKAAASANSFSLRPVITTCAPSSTKRFAVAKPMPLLPPVMTAIFPANLRLLFIDFSSRRSWLSSLNSGLHPLDHSHVKSAQWGSEFLEFSELEQAAQVHRNKAGALEHAGELLLRGLVVARHE